MLIGRWEAIEKSSLCRMQKPHALADLRKNPHPLRPPVRKRCSENGACPQPQGQGRSTIPSYEEQWESGSSCPKSWRPCHRQGPGTWHTPFQSKQVPAQPQEGPKRNDKSNRRTRVVPRPRIDAKRRHAGRPKCAPPPVAAAAPLMTELKANLTDLERCFGGKLLSGTHRIQMSLDFSDAFQNQSRGLGEPSKPKNGKQRLTPAISEPHSIALHRVRLTGNASCN